MFNHSSLRIEVHLTLWDDKTLSNDKNVKIFKAVHTFIQRCVRFNLIMFLKLHYLHVFACFLQYYNI